MMLLDLFPDGGPEHIKKLERLAAILSAYPPTMFDSYLFGRDVASVHAEEFNKLLDDLKKYYEKSIISFGWEPYLTQVKKNAPMIIFMIENRTKDKEEQVILRSISHDLRFFSYKVDDFIGLKEDDYRVQKKLGLQMDKDCMVRITNDFELKAQGVFYKSENLAFYHPFLRRFFTSNFTKITDWISILSQLEGCELRLAIDPFRLNTKEGYVELIEKDHWYGEPFTPAMLNNPKYEDRVCYWRSPERMKNADLPIDRIEVRIKQDQAENEKAFSIEEITIPPSMLDREEYALGKHAMQYSERFRLGKYAHFIWNVERQTFRHMDLAVIVYNLSDYEKKYSTQFASKDDVPSVDKIKLMRVDGNIPLGVVEGLCTDFYRYNELVGEFFAGKTNKTK